MQTWKQEEYREVRTAISVDEVMSWEQNACPVIWAISFWKGGFNYYSKGSNSMCLSLILFSGNEKWEADIFLQLWEYIFLNLILNSKRALHTLVVKNEFLKALRHLSAIPPTATYAQAFTNSCMRCVELSWELS